MVYFLFFSESVLIFFTKEFDPKLIELVPEYAKDFLNKISKKITQGIFNFLILLMFFTIF